MLRSTSTRDHSGSAASWRGCCQSTKLDSVDRDQREAGQHLDHRRAPGAARVGEDVARRRDEGGRDRRVEEVVEPRPRAEPGERLVRVPPPEPEVDERPDEEERGPEPDEPEVVDGRSTAAAAGTRRASARTDGEERDGDRERQADEPDERDHSRPRAASGGRGASRSRRSRRRAGTRRIEPTVRNSGRSASRTLGRARPHGHAATVERRPDGLGQNRRDAPGRPRRTRCLPALAGTAQAARVSVIVVPPDDPASRPRRGRAVRPRAGRHRQPERSRSPRSCAGRSSRRCSAAVALRQAADLALDAGRRRGHRSTSRCPRPASTRTRSRYPIAIVGGGYHGILTSRSTRIRGLVSIADIAPTASRARAGRPSADPLERRRPTPPPHLAQLDRRMTRSARRPALGDARSSSARCSAARCSPSASGSEYLGRAGVLAAPAVLARVAAPLGDRRHAAATWSSLLLADVGAIASALAVAVPRGAAVGARRARRSRTSSSSPPGPRCLVRRDRRAPRRRRPLLRRGQPDRDGAADRLAGGGGTCSGRGRSCRSLALALVTVGWSRAGADGGGIVVLLAAFGVLAVRMYRTCGRPSKRVARSRLVGGVVAASPPSSASTRRRAVEPRHACVPHAGPVSLAEELAHRVHISAASHRLGLDRGDRLRASRSSRSSSSRPGRRASRQATRSSPGSRSRCSSTTARATSPRPARSRTRFSGRTSGYGEPARDRAPARYRRCRCPGRHPSQREAVVSAGVAAAFAAVLAWAGPPGTDLAAHVYQRAVFLDHGFTLWNNFWYAGRYSFVTYSLLYYPLAAALGIRLLAVATVATATLAFAVLVWQRVGPARPLVEPDVRGRLGGDRPLRRLPVRARRRARAARALGAPGPAPLALRRAGGADGRGEPDRVPAARARRRRAGDRPLRPTAGSRSRPVPGSLDDRPARGAALARVPRRRPLSVLGRGARRRLRLLRALDDLRLARRAAARAALGLPGLRRRLPGVLLRLTRASGENIARLRYAAIPVAVLVLSLRDWRPRVPALVVFGLAISWNVTPLAASYVRSEDRRRRRTRRTGSRRSRTCTRT